MRLQCFPRAGLYALHAQDAFRAIEPFSGVVRHVHIHGAHLPALSAGDALFLIARYPEQGKIAHRLQKDRYRAEILAESTVVFASECQRNANRIIQDISNKKRDKQDLFHVLGLHQEKYRHIDKGCCKGDVSEEPQLFPRCLRYFVGQKIQNHGCPAGVAAPPPSKDQWTEDFGHCVVDGSCFKNAEEQVIPKSFNLHILVGENTEVQQHIAAHRPLHELPGVAFSRSKQRRAYSKASPDVAEIQQVEQVAFCEPQRHRYRFKQQEQQQGRNIFAKSVIVSHRFYPEQYLVARQTGTCRGEAPPSALADRSVT